MREEVFDREAPAINAHDLNCSTNQFFSTFQNIIIFLNKNICEHQNLKRKVFLLAGYFVFLFIPCV